MTDIRKYIVFFPVDTSCGLVFSLLMVSASKYFLRLDSVVLN